MILKEVYAIFISTVEILYLQIELIPIKALCEEIVIVLKK